MNSILSMRNVVSHAIGGGWGAENPSTGTSKVAIIRGADFPNVAVGKTSELPKRWETKSKLGQRLLKAGDIVLEISGGTSSRPTGRSVFISQQLLDKIGLPTMPASFCRLMRIDLAVANPYFIFWCLQNMFNEGRTWNYQNRSTGIANFQFEYFLDQEQVPEFSLPEQESIAATLGALDDKIESNERLAHKLNSLADLVAERMLLNEPTVSTALSQLASFNTKNSRKGQFDEIRYVDINNTRHGFIESITIHNEATAPSRAKRLVEDGDVIYSTVRPERQVFAPIFNPADNLVISTGFAVATPIAPSGTSFLTFIFGTQQFANFLGAAAGGSAYPAVNVATIKDYEVEVPKDPSQLHKYEVATISMRRLAHQIRMENLSIVSLRDALLPELMSGRIRVPEAREAVLDTIGEE